MMVSDDDNIEVTATTDSNSDNVGDNDDNCGKPLNNNSQSVLESLTNMTMAGNNNDNNFIKKYSCYLYPHLYLNRKT